MSIFKWDELNFYGSTYKGKTQNHQPHGFGRYSFIKKGGPFKNNKLIQIVGTFDKGILIQSINEIERLDDSYPTSIGVTIIEGVIFEGVFYKGKNGKLGIFEGRIINRHEGYIYEGKFDINESHAFGPGKMLNLRTKTTAIGNFINGEMRGEFIFIDREGNETFYNMEKPPAPTGELQSDFAMRPPSLGGKRNRRKTKRRKINRRKSKRK